mmetsp:Transcript_17982/g.34282  ORF Transcript_17982/g.34282 Transcript_17982/m.34282 type:complete len:549 (+) Transcript_17982:178-1824(+)
MSFFLAHGADVISQRVRRSMGSNSASTKDKDRSRVESETGMNTMDDLVNGLRSNRLRTLSLGWVESDFIRSDKSVATLEKAWQRNRSVTDVSIGYKIGQTNTYKVVEGPVEGSVGVPVHTRNRRLLCLTLDRLLAQKSSHYILSLRLVLSDWIPEHLLHAVLKQHVHLQAIEFFGVTCRTVVRSNTTQSLRSDSGLAPVVESNTLSTRSEFAAAPAAKRFLKKKRRGVANISMLNRPSAEGEFKGSRRTEPVDIVSVVMPHLVRVNSPLKSLKLIDCGLVDDDISYLVNAIQGKNLTILSLRANRYLTGTGVMELVSTSAVTDELDLSLCDFNCFDGPAIGAALAQRKVPLKRLIMCGNYQLDVHGLVALVQPAVLQKVKALDLSYCELGESRTSRILQQLLASHATPTMLREIKLQGCAVTSNVSRRALINLMSAPHSRIRRFILNDTVETGKYWSTDGLEEVAAVMPLNYDVEVLDLDFMNTSPNAKVWGKIKPLLELNRLGRRVVLPSRNVSDAEWIHGIYEASKKDLDTLYWFVRHSTERVSIK